MAAALAFALYLATAAALTLVTRWLLRWREAAEPGSDRLCHRLSWPAAGGLALVPLLFTGAGFLPGKALAPTNLLTLLAPWKDPELVARVEAGSTAPNVLLVDPVAQFLPWSRAARDDLLFNPHQGGGAALLGNGQSAVLFPTELASRVLSPLRAATYSQAARLLIAGFGMLLLVRRLGLGEAAALVGAVVYVGSGYLQLWRLHPHSLTAAMVPWVIWAALELARRPGPRAAAALAVAGALGVAAGHAETLLHGVLLAALLAGAVWIRRRHRYAGWRPVLWAGVAVFLAFLLAAPALLPFVENLTVSAEWERRDGLGGVAAEVPWGTALRQLAFAVTPWAYGDPRVLGSDGRPAGPNNAAELGGAAVGAATLLLVALAFGRRRACEIDPPPLVWLALGLAGVLVGAQVPGISRLFAVLPLLDLTLLGRLSLWGALALAVLAAMGWGRVVAGRGRREEPDGRDGQDESGRVRASGGQELLVSGALLLLLGALALFVSPARSLPGVPLEALALVFALAAAWVAPRRQVLGGALLAVALVLPRLVVFFGWIPVASSLSFYPDTLAVRHVQDELREQAEARGSGGWRVAGLDAAYLPQAAAFHGLEDARAYDPVTFAPYQRFLELWGERPAQGGVKVYDPASPGLDFLGVRWVFDHPSMGRRPGVEVSWAGRDAVVYENPGALPRVFVPREVEIVEGEADAMGIAAAVEEAGQRVAVQGERLPPLGRYPNGEARVVELTIEPGRVVAVVEAEERAVVATSQPAIPGWRLTRDGERFGSLRIHGAFLGAAVEPGTSRLEWRYAPATWRWGWGLFALGLVMAVACGSSSSLEIRKWTDRRARRFTRSSRTTPGELA